MKKKEVTCLLLFGSGSIAEVNDFGKVYKEEKCRHENEVFHIMAILKNVGQRYGNKPLTAAMCRTHVADHKVL